MYRECGFYFILSRAFRNLLKKLRDTCAADNALGQVRWYGSRPLWPRRRITFREKSMADDSRIQKFEEFLAKDPRDPMFHYGLGNELSKSGRVADAVESFEEAIRVKHNQAFQRNISVSSSRSTGSSIVSARRRIRSATPSERRSLKKHSTDHILNRALSSFRIKRTGALPEHVFLDLAR